MTRAACLLAAGHVACVGELGRASLGEDVMTEKAGQVRVDRARRRESEAIQKLVEEVRAREAQDLECESEATPYREAEEIARGLYRGR